jgi:hypothetical protein
MAHEAYYKTSDVARALVIDRKAVPKIASAAGVRVRQLPGCAVEYLKEDIDRIAAESVGVAGKMGGSMAETTAYRGGLDDATAHHE